VQVGGASGVTLAAYEFDRRIAFEDVPTAGAFMVFDSTRDPFEIAHAFVDFFAHESCGFCTPCRVGTVAAQGLHGQARARIRRQDDLADIEWINRCCAIPATADSDVGAEPGGRHPAQVSSGLRAPAAGRWTSSRPSIWMRRWSRAAHDRAGRSGAIWTDAGGER
jgi:hypothetical protein